MISSSRPVTYTNLRIDFNGYRPDAVAVVKDLRLFDFSAFFYTESSICLPLQFSPS